jgi:hypothetical protein
MLQSKLRVDPTTTARRAFQLTFSSAFKRLNVTSVEVRVDSGFIAAVCWEDSTDSI